MSERDARFWDKTARKYAASPVADEAAFERTLERTRHYLKPSDSVLEFGCGTGSAALKLAPSAARYVGSDISGEMIAIAREKAQAAGLANLSFEQAVMNAPPWPAGSFDAILGFNIVHLVEDRPRVLENVRNLLKPGGVFVSKTFCLKDSNPLFRVLVPVMQAVGMAPTVSFLSADQLAREIEAAGFTIVETQRHGSKTRDSRPFIVARKTS
ncbi:MAG: class I SAM-dependent methyltransferase [Hyphomonadaceae bacterium]